MNIRKAFIFVIILICIFALAYGIYYQIFQENKPNIKNETNVMEGKEEFAFDEIFDNNINYQNYNIDELIKIDKDKELVYTDYTLNESYKEKYNIKVNIPAINVNNENITNINKEINALFREKANSIVVNKDSEELLDTVYNVEYTACVNENILSVVIKCTLKEGNNAQRLIIKAYTYNLSSNEIIPLSNMLEIKGKNIESVESDIRDVIKDSISKTDNLSALGYPVFKRNINSEIYKVKNSNNYFLGPNANVYIIYAYGNTEFTTEKDIVVI